MLPGQYAWFADGRLDRDYYWHLDYRDESRSDFAGMSAQFRSLLRESVARAAADFKTDSWRLTVDGLVEQPTVFSLDELLKIGPAEERVSEAAGRRGDALFGGSARSWPPRGLLTPL